MTEITGIIFKVSFRDEYKAAVVNAYEAVMKDPSYSNRLIFAAVLQMYWEESMNSWIIDVMEKLNPDNKEAVINDLTWYSARKKVNMLTQTLTQNHLKVDVEHPDVLKILEFIKIRNSLIHRKDRYSYVQADAAKPGQPGSIFPISTADPSFEMLSPEKCTEFLKAFEHFIAATYLEFKTKRENTVSEILILA